MTGNHPADDELLDGLYGVRPENEHPRTCPECARRLRDLAAVRAEVVRPPEVTSDFLAAQRRSIYRRMESPLGAWHPLRWAFLLATLLALALGLTLYRAERAHPSRDDQFFSEVSSLDRASAPLAVQPIEALVGDDAQP